MKNKSLEMVMLYDFYGATLTEKQSRFFDLYYNEDLSLSEIAENENITRQGVRDAILRAENILRDMEAKLGRYARYGSICDGLEKIAELAQEIKRVNSQKFLSGELDDLAREITSLTLDLREGDLMFGVGV